MKIFPEKPGSVEVRSPEYSLVGLVAPLEFLCTTAMVHPAPSLSWTVRDWEDQDLEHQAGSNISIILCWRDISSKCLFVSFDS